MSRLEEARRLRVQAADLRAEGRRKLQLGDEEEAKSLFDIAKGFERDASRFTHRTPGDDIVFSRAGWKKRPSA